MFQLTEKSQISSYIRDQSQTDSSNVLRLIDAKIFAHRSPVLVSNKLNFSTKMKYCFTLIIVHVEQKSFSSGPSINFSVLEHL